MLTYIILAIILVGIALIAMSFNILISKKRAFPESSISKNKALRKQKIYCIKTEQKIIDNQLVNCDSGGGSCCGGF